MSDLFQPVRDFEEKIANYTGFLYGVAVESCSAALFLSCLYKNIQGAEVNVPSKTYPSAVFCINHAGGVPVFDEKMNNWQEVGYYELGDTGIIDSAKYIKRGMRDCFHSYNLVCLSFHAKKNIPIGRGGMILSDDIDAVEWLRMARHDGRHDKTPLKEDNITVMGWNFLMTPEQASRGLSLMDNIRDGGKITTEDYPDVSRYKIWNG